MMFVGGRPAPINPCTTAAATATRVPLFGPGLECTLMPTTSSLDTSACQAAASLVLPVHACTPRTTILRTVFGSGRNAWVASPSRTTMTRAVSV